MEKLLLDTFGGIRLTDRQRDIFQDVYVERILVMQKSKEVAVYLVSDYIIAYREIALLESAIGKKFFGTGYEVKVFERFRLSEQYNQEAFWKEYHDSVLLMLKERNVLEFDMLYGGKAHVSDDLLIVECDDDEMYRSR